MRWPIMLYRSPLLIGLKVFFDTFKTLLNVLVDDWRHDKGYDLMALPSKFLGRLQGHFFL